VRVRAVIFDLWDTLVEWPAAEGARLVELLAGLASLTPSEIETRLRACYRALQTRPLAEVYKEFGIPDDRVPAALAAHHELARRNLRLRAGAGEALTRLRVRGLKLGLITVCSEDVPAAWATTDLAGRFDVETFSSVCGLMKPEPEIYLRTTRALGVEPDECLFVGDGANDELGGAERVGIRPVLFAPAGTTPRWPEVSNWNGMRVSSIEEVLGLC
jgi:putative hydrolase of the HAD superfamily